MYMYLYMYLYMSGAEAAAKKWRGLINIHDLDVPMKSLARRYVWRLKTRQNLALPCQSVKHGSAAAPLHPWV